MHHVLRLINLTIQIFDSNTNFPATGFYFIQSATSPSSTSPEYVPVVQREVIQYTGKSGGLTLTGLTRGTNAPFRGETPANTIASNHDAGANVFGAREVYSLDTTTSPSTGQPPTFTDQNGYFLKDRLRHLH